MRSGRGAHAAIVCVEACSADFGAAQQVPKAERNAEAPREVRCAFTREVRCAFK